MGGEVAIMMDMGGDARAARANAARRILAERKARRDAALVGPEPSETPQEKVRRLARERRARG